MKLKDYILNCNEVYHTTIDPKGPGVVRIHLIPPEKLKLGIPWIVILNGYYLLPLQTAWAVLLKIYIEERNASSLDYFDDYLFKKVALSASEIFIDTEIASIKKDIRDIVKVLKDVARGKKPDLKIGFMSLKEYGKYMSAPHRLDLMVSSMYKDNKWSCNQKCLHCYAADEKLSYEKELTKEEWFKIIDEAKKARIPQLTFTGGEPTLRKDLPELINYASWFVTRLNTNGICLTKELCQKLYDASLDSVQITFYSSNPEIHNKLVGGNNFEATKNGIINALNAGLDVSVNTPLCNINKDYLETIIYLQQLGVTFFSCSGLIPSGNAKKASSEITSLSKKEITSIIIDAYNYAKDNNLELLFTSPGWIDAKVLESMKMIVPSCGACLSNMAVSPSGNVIPCQSWLNGEIYGNMLQEPFKNIWKNKECKKRRKMSMKNKGTCQLRDL